ncbi:MAG: hypothetical protein IJM26_07080, partial [Lachnospiraceae bacterium]|nr:hypothetical protein [Lachnospiraceae bacterium]
YKPVLGDQTVKVGDGIDFTGAVGIYNSKFQLRNTEASEIKVTAGEDPIDPPVGDEIDKLTEPLTDGTFVVIYHPTSGMALTATASGSKLAGVTAAVADGKLTKTDDMAYMTVVESEGALAFELGGKYLTSGATGNSLTFADELTDLGRWTQEKQDDGTWYLMNVGANYNGNHNQALEYYNGFTTYGRKENNDAYKFEIYGVEAAPSYGLLDAVTNGAKVVIYHPTSSMTMTATASGAKLAGVASEMAAPNRLAKLDDMAYMTVAKADGVVTFELNGQYLTSADTGNGLSFSDTLTDMGRWTLEKQDDGTWYVKNVGANYNGNHNQALEYYSGFTTYGFKTTDAYKFQFFGTPGEDEPIDPPDPGEEKEYGLVKTLAEGDLVIIYNRASGKGVSSEMIGSYYLAGVDLTDEENVIKTSNEDVIWTVHVNEDGTNTFTQGPVTFGGVQTTNASTGRVYNNINLSEPTATLWTREDTANEGEYYLYLGELPSSKTGGHIYLDWYANYSEFSLNDYANPGTNSAYMFSFYKQDAEPEIEPGDLGDLVTDLSKLTDGTTVSIYSPGHHTAISSKPNGDWYLKANTANIVDGKVTDFTSDFVWTVKVNENGTYSFYSYDDPTKSITVWPSGNYAELSLNVETYPDNTWTLTPAATKNCFYFSSPTVSGTRGPAYIEAYVRNEFEVFSGYFTSPTQSNFKDSDFALQFYLVNPEDAVATHDDGEWDGVLTPGKQYVAHNVAADSSIGLFDPANYSMKAIPTTFDGGKAIPDNGAYVWTVGSMGRYYSFQMNGKYLASNNEEELFLIDPNEDGTVPENAKWFLVAKEGGYIIYNKDASYNGTPVCIEYFSSVFSGWTYNTKNELAIYLFNFYELADGVKVYHDVVQNPTVKFECEDSRYVEQDYALAFTLDDLAPEITDIAISFTAGSQTVPVTEYESSEDGKAYSCVIPASLIDVEEGMESFTIKVVVNNS